MEKKHYILVNLFAVFYLVLALLVFMAYMQYRPYEKPVDLLSAIFILNSVLWIIISIGIFKRKLSIYFLLLCVLFFDTCWKAIMLSTVICEYPFSTLKFLEKVSFIAFYGFNIYYFLTPKVKEQFK
jgi:hypothetical protein